MKQSAIIFGAGDNFNACVTLIEKLYNIVAIVDNSPAKQGTIINGVKIISLNETNGLHYDFIIVTPTDSQAIIEQLAASGIDKSKIIPIGDAFDHYFATSKLLFAFFIYGGLGDFIIFYNWLEHFKQKFKIRNAQIDIFLLEKNVTAAKSVFREKTDVNNIYGIITDAEFAGLSRNYDFMMKFCIFPYVYSFFGEKLLHQNAELLNYVLDLQKFGLLNYNYAFCNSPFYYKTCRKLFDMFANKKYHTYCDVFNNLGITDKYIGNTFIDIDETEYLESVNLNGERYITINTGENATYIGKGNTRTWSFNNWRKLVLLVKEKYPDINIIQIGTKTSDSDDISSNLNLVGKTNLEQTKILLKNAFLHIDYDGGLVHLRHIYNGGTSIVLFGSTAIENHDYSENIHIRADVCPACEWTKVDWGFRCSKGFDTPLCMQSITPDMVMKEIEKICQRSGDSLEK